ncbi:MAG TPA: uroporphyrinogen-III synthase [Acidobacteriaceae bacterium]|nr:uroporphyrinogen-III synthase [Acidobacteriaceae bacterium]
MSLTGKRVLVTRAREQASQLAAALRAAGAEPIEIPAIAIVPPHSYAHIDGAIGALKEFDWLIFTSANAVRVFCERALYAGVHPAAAGLQIAVVGPATAEAVRVTGMKVALVPPKFVAESLLEALRPLVGGESVLLVRAEVARDVLPSGLRAAGAEVTVADAYRNELPAGSVAKLKDIFNAKALIPQAITFTSSSTARNAHALLLAAGVIVPPETVLASIGPVTSATMRELGFLPTVEAQEATIGSLVEALVEYFS